MAEDNLVGQTFSSIAEGYGGAQQTLARFGFVPGSFLPSDKGGAAPQLPTMPPPRFATVASTTLPFPSAVPQFAGAAAAPPPAPLPPMFQAGQPTFTPGMQQAFGPPVPQMGTYAMPMPSSGSMGMPITPPNFSRMFSRPMTGTQQQGGFFAGGSLGSDLFLAGYMPTALSLDAPGTGVNIMRQRYEAGSRLVDRGLGYAGTAVNVASAGLGILGGAAALGIGGATLGGIAAAGGMVALPLAAAGMGLSAYNERRDQVKQVAQIMSGVASGPLAGPLGTGIDQSVARQIQRGLFSKPGVDTFSTEDYLSTFGQAQEMGLMRGRTNSVDQIVKRVKELAKLSKSIMDLGEGITQKDALEMQMLAQNMGLSTSKFASQGIASKILASARLTGQSMGAIMSGAGTEGASLFAQMGMNAGAGMMTGVSSAALAANMVNSGRLSDREVAMFGGESGLGNLLMKNMAGFQSRNATNMVLGSLLNKNAFQQMVTGAVGMDASAGSLTKMLSGKGVSSSQRDVFYQLFEEKAPDLLNSLQEGLTPERMQLMMLNQAKTLMGSSKKPLTAFSAFKQVTGSEEGARALMKLMQDPSVLKSSYKQIDTIERESNQRASQELEEYRGIFSRIGRATSQAIYKTESGIGVDAAVDYASEQDAEQAARAAGYDVDRKVRRAAGADSARRRIRERLKAGYVNNLLLEDGAYQAPRSQFTGVTSSSGTKSRYVREAEESASMFTDEDISASGNLKNAGFAINTFERFGFDVKANRFTDFFTEGRNGQALGQLREFENLRREAGMAVDAFNQYDRFGSTPGSAGSYITGATSDNSENQALFQALNSAVEESIRGSGTGLPLTRTALTSRVAAVLKERGLDPSRAGNLMTTGGSRMLGAILKDKQENRNSTDDTRKAIEGLRANTKATVDINLGLSTSDYSLERFGSQGSLDINIGGTPRARVVGDMRSLGNSGGPLLRPESFTIGDVSGDFVSRQASFKDSREARRALDEVQAAAVGLGIEDADSFSLLLETNGSVDLLRDKARSGDRRASKLLKTLEKEENSGAASGLSKVLRTLNSQINSGSANSSGVGSIRSKLASILSDKGSIAQQKNFAEVSVLTEGLDKLGLVDLTSAAVTPMERAKLARKFTEEFTAAGESAGSGKGLTGEDLIRQMVTSTGGSADTLLSSPTFSGISEVATELAAYKEGGFRSKSSNAAAKRKELTAKLNSMIQEAALTSTEDPTGTGGPAAGEKDAIQQQVEALKSIAEMNKKTAEILSKLAGDNGTVQGLTAAVQKLQEDNDWGF